MGLVLRTLSSVALFREKCPCNQTRQHRKIQFDCCYNQSHYLYVIREEEYQWHTCAVPWGIQPLRKNSLNKQTAACLSLVLDSVDVIPESSGYFRKASLLLVQWAYYTTDIDQKYRWKLLIADILTSLLWLGRCCCAWHIAISHCLEIPVINAHYQVVYITSYIYVRQKYWTVRITSGDLRYELNWVLTLNCAILLIITNKRISFFQCK